MEVFLHVPLRLDTALLMQVAAVPFTNVSTIFFKWKKGVMASICQWYSYQHGAWVGVVVKALLY